MNHFHRPSLPVTYFLWSVIKFLDEPTVPHPQRDVLKQHFPGEGEEKSHANSKWRLRVVQNYMTISRKHLFVTEKGDTILF